MFSKHRAMFAAAVSSLAAVVAAAPAVRAEILEQILVKVNGEIFTKTELEARQIAVLRQRGLAFDLKSEQADAQLRKALDEITPQILVEVVDDMLIVQRGRELGYKLTDDQFKNAVDSIKKENKIENDEQFQAALKQENMTMADLRRNFERQMIVARVEQNEVSGKTGVNEEEARKYYQAHLADFTTSPSVTLREILVAIPADPKGINVAADDAAKEKAESVRARAQKGDSFEKVAAELSDAPSRSNGGLIGPISTKDLSADLQKLVESMKPGDISSVVRTARGYLIFRLESSTGSKTLPFDQAREQVNDHVFADKREAALRKYLEKLRSEAIIEWKNPDIKRAYDEGLARLAKSGNQTKGAGN